MLVSWMPRKRNLFLKLFFLTFSGNLLKSKLTAIDQQSAAVWVRLRPRFQLPSSSHIWTSITNFASTPSRKNTRWRLKVFTPLLMVYLLYSGVIMRLFLKDVMSRLESNMPTLESLLGQVEQFVASEKSYQEVPFVIDVMLPMMCSYLPFWYAQGPDNQNPTGG